MTFAVRSEALTEDAARGLVARALAATRRHDAAEELMSCLAPHGLVLHLPGVTLRGRHEVRRWYQALVHGHALRCRAATEAEVRLTSPLHAEISVDLAWSTRRRQAPGHGSVHGRAARLSLSAVLQGGTPRIRTCVVHPLPAPHSPA